MYDFWLGMTRHHINNCSSVLNCPKMLREIDTGLPVDIQANSSWINNLAFDTGLGVAFDKYGKVYTDDPWKKKASICEFDCSMEGENKIFVILECVIHINELLGGPKCDNGYKDTYASMVKVYGNLYTYEGSGSYHEGLEKCSKIGARLITTKTPQLKHALYLILGKYCLCIN